MSPWRMQRKKLKDMDNQDARGTLTVAGATEKLSKIRTD